MHLCFIITLCAVLLTLKLKQQMKGQRNQNIKLPFPIMERSM
jgi:hypothetical protein